ncbi:hypothetical protein LguiB_020553 [Lonicera macranthoides]
MVLTRSGRKRLEMSKMIAQVNMSMSEDPTINAPPTVNAPATSHFTENYAACVKGVQELGFDGHQIGLAAAKFIESEGWQYFFLNMSREDRISWISHLS